MYHPASQWMFATLGQENNALRVNKSGPDTMPLPGNGKKREASHNTITHVCWL